MNSEPLYMKVRNYVLKLITDKALSEGDKIPSESELVKLCGVSTITVKRALLELQNEGLIYSKKGIGSFVGKQSKNKVLGVILQDIRNSVFAEMIHGIESEAIQNGFNTVIGNNENDYGKLMNYVDQFLSSDVAGIILAPLQDNYEVLKNIRIARSILNEGVPLVLIDRNLQGIGVDYVGTNNVEAAQQLTAHLIDNGCRRIAFISDPVCSTNEERIKGYKMTLRERGIETDNKLIFISDLQGKEAGEESARKLLQIKPLPDGIFAINDWVAYGAMEFLLQQGIRIPRDIAMVGFDNVAIAHETPVSLTTMEQPSGEIGKQAARALFERIENP
ncbi:GntR family transcriptional regulator, partial [Candidatus Sumerlaeota bacterium]|nr:GntR family transcriptional regulator [Candidatus Sumerlaeota bacterium]